MSEAELNRRDFVATAAALAAAVTACTCCGGAEALAETPSTPGGGNAPSVTGNKVDAGPMTTYAKDGIWDNFAKSNRVLIVRAGDKVYAPSATCTHKSCAVRLKSPGQLACPCHGSKFDSTGKPQGGPAKASLLRYAVSIDDNQHLIVDKSKQFGEKEWDNEGASVKA
jgi:Rieske Fe-S protein